MNKSRSKNVGVIGAGVSGITCALVCQIMGYDVTIYTKEVPFKDDSSPAFSSLYPAASVIPHAVNHPDMLNIFKESNSIFELLFQNNFVGIEKHKHFEFYTNEPTIPDYTKCYSSIEFFDENKNTFRPKHPTLDSMFGWCFDCLFADWGTYYPALFRLFEKRGGKILNETITAESVYTINSEVIINCAEIFGATIIGEELAPTIYRGHLLHIPGMPMLKTEAGQKVSYNFIADTDVYASENGSEQDVYLYQRDDRWIFGGSRQKGTIDDSGKWIGEEVIEPTFQVNGEDIPKQILTLNSEIINHTFGEFDIDLNRVQTKLGYRFMGNSDDQLRLDQLEIGDKLIINNFGHGGSGVTLSWGCALMILELLNDRFNIPNVEKEHFTLQLINN